MLGGVDGDGHVSRLAGKEAHGYAGIVGKGFWSVAQGKGGISAAMREKERGKGKRKGK